MRATQDDEGFEFLLAETERLAQESDALIQRSAELIARSKFTVRWTQQLAGERGDPDSPNARRKLPRSKGRSG
jgi:hypothetical protein